MLPIYAKIAGKLFNKKKSGTKPKTKMKKLKLSPTQKAKLKGFGKKAVDLVKSGKAQTATAQMTRFVQGKPVLIRNPKAKGDQKTVQIMGYSVPQEYAIIGGLALGAVAIGAMRRNRS